MYGHPGAGEDPSGSNPTPFKPPPGAFWRHWQCWQRRLALGQSNLTQ